jgi:serine/threonine protein phosphatase PrpC
MYFIAGDPFIPSFSNSNNLMWGASGVQGTRPKNMEDLYIVDSFKIGSTHYNLFAIADGHGGRLAAEWFISRISSRLSQCLQYFNDNRNKSKLKHDIINQIKILDSEFCELRKSQYINNQGDDDGTTLNIVIINDKFCIVINIGDSRTFVSNLQKVVFQTLDHSPENILKSKVIEDNGGVFKKQVMGSKGYNLMTMPNGTKGIDLIDSRVFRPNGFNTDPYGLKIKNMSLTDSLGDVLMKLDPPLFECKPEVDIFDLNHKESCIIVMATDGLYSSMIAKDPINQCQEISNIISKELTIKSCGNNIVYPPMGNNQSLKNISSQLSSTKTGSCSHLFNNDSEHVDDVVCILIKIIPNLPITPKTTTHQTPNIKAKRKFIHEQIMPTTPIL